MKLRGMLVPDWADIESLPVSTHEIQQPSADLVEYFDLSLAAVRENLEQDYLKQPKYLYAVAQQTYPHETAEHIERVTDGLLSSLSEFTGQVPNEGLKEKACKSILRVYEEARRGALLKSALRDANSQDLRTRQIEALHDIKSIEPRERSRLIRTAWSGVVYSLEAKDAAKTEDFLKVLNAVSFTDVNPIRSQLKSAVIGLVAMDRGRELLPHDFESIKSVSEIVQNAGDAKNYESDLNIHRAIVTNIAERYIDSMTSEDLSQAAQYKKLIEALGVELDIDPQSLQQSTATHMELADLSPEEVLQQITTLSDKASRVRVEYDPATNRAKVVSRAVGLGVTASAILATQINPAAAAPSAAYETPKLVSTSIVQFAMPQSAPVQDIETSPVTAAPKIIQIDIKPAGNVPDIAPTTAGEPAVVSIDMNSVVAPDAKPISIDTVDSKLTNVDDLISFYLKNNSSSEAYRLIAQKVETLYDVEAVSFPGFQNKLDTFIKNLDQEAAGLQLTDQQQFDYTFKTLYAKLLAEYPSLLSQVSIDSLLTGNEQFAALVGDKWLDQEHGFASAAGDNYTDEQRKAIEQVLASAMAGLLSDADKTTLMTQLDPSYKPPVVAPQPQAVTPTQPAPAPKPKHHPVHKPHHKPQHAKAPTHGGSASTPGVIVESHNDQSIYDNGNYRYGFMYYVNHGFTEAGAAAIIGNFTQESHMNPHIIQGGGEASELPIDKIENQLGYGIAQWTSGGRQRALIDLADSEGKLSGDLDVQLEEALNELGNYPDLIQYLKTTKNVEEATRRFEIEFERAGSPMMQSRKQFAKQIFDANTKIVNPGNDQQTSTPDNQGLSLVDEVLSYTGVDRIVSHTNTGQPLPDKLDKVVYYSQWDERWYDKPYNPDGESGRTISSSGCGPTTQAMVISTLTGKDVLPDEMAKWNLDHGFRVDGGTAYAALTASAEANGLHSQFIDTSTDAIRNAVKNGALVIVNGTDTDLSTPATSAGHIYLVRDVTADGKFQVSDANSITKSLTNYAPSDIVGPATVAVAITK